MSYLMIIIIIIIVVCCLTAGLSVFTRLLTTEQRHRHSAAYEYENYVHTYNTSSYKETW